MGVRQSAAIALVIGLVCGLVCFGIVSAGRLGAADFQHALGMARDLLAGRDVYAHEPGPYWIPYPLPAALVGLPFVAFPDALAAALFFGFSSALLSLGILRTGEAWRLPMLLSWPFVYSMIWVQWSPLMCALWFFPAISWFALFKPNIALPFVLTSRLKPATIAMGAVTLGLSLLIRWDWPLVWLQQTSSYQGKVPPLFTLPFGPLILLALVNWRERRTWLIVFLALMPQRAFYDQLPLLLVANNNRELLWLFATSWVGFAVLWMSPNMAEMPGGVLMWVVLGHYLPAASVMVWSCRERIASWIRTKPLSSVS